jgi:hypothetical protein
MRKINSVDIGLELIETKINTSSMAGTARNAATIVTPVQPLDETGAIIKGGGASLAAEYLSPKDFTVTYTSASTVTLTGVNFVIENGAQIAYIKVRNSATNRTNTYVNGSAGYGFAHSSGVVTAYLNGIAVSIFTANDMYELGINAQKKAYDPTTDVLKIVNQSPDRASYVQDSLVDTTNITAGTIYYPSSTGMSMDGFKDLSLTGKLIEGDAVLDTIAVEVTNDEDPATADWITVYWFNPNTNAMQNLITTASVAGTYLFTMDFDNFNYSYFRVKVILADSTNTLIVKSRRKSL